MPFTAATAGLIPHSGYDWQPCFPSLQRGPAANVPVNHSHHAIPWFREMPPRGERFTEHSLPEGWDSSSVDDCHAESSRLDVPSRPIALVSRRPVRLRG